MASNNSDPPRVEEQDNSIADDARPDVAAAVEELLNSLSNKFASVSSELFAKMDEMSRRLDNLESTVSKNKNEESGSNKSP